MKVIAEIIFVAVVCAAIYLLLVAAARWLEFDCAPWQARDPGCNYGCCEHPEKP